MENEIEDKTFRAAVINAWISNKMERDRSLLTLSSAAIGLLVTFLNFNDSLNNCEVIFYAVAFLAFLICIGSVITIFSKNPDYLEKLVKEEDVENDKFLGALDYAAVISFCVGVFSTTLIGVIKLI